MIFPDISIISCENCVKISHYDVVIVVDDDDDHDDDDFFPLVLLISAHYVVMCNNFKIIIPSLRTIPLIVEQ